ncbi:Peptidase M20 domain-containing protein 2 [Argiope bruennichi]|uniref:Peptidase M20 domain-containing protein 2 n=1 Tax=Argiope bruennichi TaxID=94029 RepID=A0A8T0E178_ARGBR|nr:Peptidase M20 domain-containing protein 2 [Argiope bruennichi]
MTETDFSCVSAKIDSEKDFLNSISEVIWKNPELAYEEKFAHDTLTSALSKCGFQVQKHYVLPTAFKAEHVSKTEDGPVIAVLLEYDALPEIGHGCGHNLISEVGLAASLGIKAAMEADSTLAGKLLVIGAPAEESKAGKADLLKGGAFEGVDAAMMAHPCHYNTTYPPIQSMVEISVIFTGKETHAASSPWAGRNALDAAVAAYQNIALLRQHIKHTDKIHAIITKGGTVPNIIPAESRMELFVRSITRTELWELVPRVTECLKSGASAAGCKVEIIIDKDHCNENLISNKIMGELYDTYAHKFGIYATFAPGEEEPSGSTDMGNVSHAVPSIHPMYNINTEALYHTKEFREASGDPRAQEPTLNVAKALAMTALTLMRNPKILDDAKKEFREALAKGL